MLNSNVDVNYDVYDYDEDEYDLYQHLYRLVYNDNLRHSYSIDSMNEKIF